MDTSMYKCIFYICENIFIDILKICMQLILHNFIWLKCVVLFYFEILISYGRRNH